MDNFFASNTEFQQDIFDAPEELLQSEVQSEGEFLNQPPEDHYAQRTVDEDPIAQSDDVIAHAVEENDGSELTYAEGLQIAIQEALSKSKEEILDASLLQPQEEITENSLLQAKEEFPENMFLQPKEEVIKGSQLQPTETLGDSPPGSSSVSPPEDQAPNEKIPSPTSKSGN